MTETTVRDWRIDTFSDLNDFCESVFFTGNGRLGLRGFAGWKAKTDPQEHAIFRAGLFSHIKTGITDMVQLPDVTTLIPEGHAPGKVRQSLDMRRGVVEYRWEKENFSFLLSRMASMAENDLICCRLAVTARRTGELTVTALADAEVANLPVHDDQMTASKDLVTLLIPDLICENGFRYHTRGEGTPVFVRWLLTDNKDTIRTTEITDNGQVRTSMTARLAAGETWIVEKRILILTGGEEKDFPPGDPWEESEKVWRGLWQDCDIRIQSDDPELQGAVRYNIYQMLASNAADDPHVSIGARGLTHGRYKGNTFWDTEIFLFPFYLWTRPEAARNLLKYRAERLSDAKKLAKKQNLDGARFPWMCSTDGMEQCESWDIGLCEVHITADIVYAMDRYCRVTGDFAFRKTVAEEVFAETARYWRSRLTWEPARRQYSSFFVKGPDEYCGAAVNNTYTNFMARHNIDLALETDRLTAEERAAMTDIRDRIAILYDPARNLYLQDETLERLQPLENRTTGHEPLYRTICFDRLQRYRVLKQADLVLLMTLFPDRFTPAEKKNVFEVYEPITLHDSTLSWGVHANLALQLGLWDKAEEYLKPSLLLDLKDLMGSTGREGIHMAALGAAWQAVVFGIAGLWDDGERLRLKPMFPPSVSAVSFSVFFRGRRYRIDADRDGHQLITGV